MRSRTLFVPALLAVSLALSLTPLSVRAQTPADERCAATVDELVSRMENDYVGFTAEMVGERREEFDSARAAATAQAREAEDRLACHRILQELVAVLEDGHVFVLSNPVGSPADSARWVSSIRRVNPIRARREAASAPGDSPVGLWYGAGGERTAIVPDPDRPGHLVAVWLEGQDEPWSPGGVRAEFAPMPDGSWDVVDYGAEGAPRRIHVFSPDGEGGGIARRGGSLLRLPPHVWGRLSQVRPGDEAALDPVDPRAPVIRRIEGDVVVVSLPSHQGTYRPRLQNLVDRWSGALDRAPLIVIDVRGNEGGGSRTSDPLLPWIPARPPSSGRQSIAAVRSSDLNIDVFEGLLSQGWIPEGLIDRMRERPGELVPFYAPGSQPEPRPDPLRGSRAGERPVAVLVDRGAVSAAESFLLSLEDAPGVTFFGAPSAGTIDYQNVRLHRLGTPEWGFLLGLPLFARDIDLPEGGVNRTGIPVDVAIDPDDAPFEAILDWYGIGGG